MGGHPSTHIAKKSVALDVPASITTAEAAYNLVFHQYGTAAQISSACTQNDLEQSDDPQGFDVVLAVSPSPSSIVSVLVGRSRDQACSTTKPTTCVLIERTRLDARTFSSKMYVVVGPSGALRALVTRPPSSSACDFDRQVGIMLRLIKDRHGLLFETTHRMTYCEGALKGLDHPHVALHITLTSVTGKRMMRIIAHGIRNTTRDTLRVEDMLARAFNEEVHGVIHGVIHGVGTGRAAGDMPGASAQVAPAILESRMAMGYTAARPQVIAAPAEIVVSRMAASYAAPPSVPVAVPRQPAMAGIVVGTALACHEVQPVDWASGSIPVGSVVVGTAPNMDYNALSTAPLLASVGN